MAKHTTRDRVWTVTLNVAAEKWLSGSSKYSRTFDHDDVRRAMDDPASGKTIRETMTSMANPREGEPILWKNDYRSEYRLRMEELFRGAGDDDEEEDSIASSGLSGQFSSRGREQERPTGSEAALASEGAAESTQPAQGRQESEETPARPEAGGTTAESTEPEHGATARPQEASSETTTTELTMAVAELDLATDARRDVVLCAGEHLRDQGEATKKELLAECSPDDLAGYETEASLWEHVVRKGLKALEADHGLIESPPAGGRYWAWSGPEATV